MNCTFAFALKLGKVYSHVVISGTHMDHTCEWSTSQMLPPLNLCLRTGKGLAVDPWLNEPGFLPVKSLCFHSQNKSCFLPQKFKHQKGEGGVRDL